MPWFWRAATSANVVSNQVHHCACAIVSEEDVPSLAMGAAMATTAMERMVAMMVEKRIFGMV
jgi:hypothetical protein